MFTVTQRGEELSKDKYTWCEDTKTFSTNESYLILDFSNTDGVTFKTGSSCTFKTGSDCTFKTLYYCTFNTGSYCTFNTGSNCTFDTGSDCTFKTGSESVCIRRDIYEVIEIPKNKTIKINGRQTKGYTVIGEKKKITIDGKEIEISEDSYEELKKSLLS